MGARHQSGQAQSEPELRQRRNQYTENRSLPGEPFAEIGAAIRKASPFAFTLLCGYSSGRTGDYLPIESEYKYGGYEVERTPYGLGAADKVISESIGLFTQVR